jgi:hypothetical protein
MNLELDVKALEFKIAPTKKHPMNVEYLSETREVLIHASLPEKESLTVDTDDDVVIISFQKVDLRLSEEAVTDGHNSLHQFCFDDLRTESSNARRRPRDVLCSRNNLLR